MKQRTRDRAREVLNDGMDIHAGSAICIGDNNFMEKFYRSAPIGITVEGSNTLTRNLIIFGQGLNKSHPYIYPVLESILENNEKKFEESFSEILKHSITTYFRSIINKDVKTELEKQTLQYSNMANVVALKGGALKSEQFLSADMADIFSNLYLAYSVLWYQEQHKVSKVLTDYCVDRLCNENQKIINRVVDNLGGLGYMLLFAKKSVKDVTYDKHRSIIEELNRNDEIMKYISKDIYMKDTILEKLKKLDDVGETDYEKMYNEVIQVAEYENN